MERIAEFLRPMMLRPPPALGSRHPGDLLSLLREAGRAAGLSRRDLHDFYRVMTMSVGDLLDDWFEHDAFKGAFASTGVVGVWAGPRTPGTAYNLLHHELGEIDGVPGLWGHVRGGMGAISMAIARSAEASGAVVRTGASVRSIDVVDGRTVGVTLEGDEQLRAPVVLSGAHPKTTVLDMVGAQHFPDEVVEDMRRYKTRGGSVKVNWVLSEPPRYEGVSDDDQARLIRSGVAFCPSIDYLERAWQDACRGVPSEAPYLEVECPSSIDSSLTDDGTFVMTMFTQYGPWEEAGWPEGSREAYADRCLEILASRAPNVRDAVVHYEVLAPPDLERIFGLVGGSIFQGEQGLDQMAFMRPTPALAQYATPVDGLYLCGAGHASGRRRDGARRPQRRAARAARPALAARAAAGAGGAAGLNAAGSSPSVRRGRPHPAGGEGRAGRRAAAGSGRRAHPRGGSGRGSGGWPARARARRAGMVEARVGAGRGAVRALDQRAVVARAERLQRARPRGRTSRSTATCGRRCAASCRTPTR